MSVIAMDESNVFVSTAQRRHASKRLLLVAAIVFVVIVILGVAGFLEHRSHQTQNFNAALNTANNEATNGHFSQALAKLQSVEGEAHTKQQKIQLYSLFAAYTASDNQLQTALHYYSLKHQLDSSSVGPDAYQMASIYYQLKQYGQAINQFEIAINYLKVQKHNGYEALINEYNQNIQYLKGLQ
jgi:hypothetical protein